MAKGVVKGVVKGGVKGVVKEEKKNDMKEEMVKGVVKGVVKSGVKGVVKSVVKEETKNDMKEEMVKETKTKTTKNVTRQDEDNEEEAYLAAVRDEVNLLLRLAGELHTQPNNLLSITQSLSSLQRNLESVGVPQEESSRYHMSLSDAIQNTMKDLRSPYEAVRSLALTRLEQIIQTQSKGPSSVSL